MLIKKQYFIWVYPLVVLIAQVISPIAVLVSGAIFLLVATLVPKLKHVLILFGATVIGHYLWLMFVALLNWCGLAENIVIITGRLGLLGYLIVFLVWMKIEPTKHNYLHLGKADTEIYFPFIWSGRKEPIWRFILIFSAMCVISIIVLAISGKITLEIVVLGMIFTLVNATLEELLWRGLILPRAVDITGENQALIITALAFGLYHISLGFPLWTCFMFAIGGFYMGGSAIISKGLLAPWIMHIMVNLIFVFAGLIF